VEIGKNDYGIVARLASELVKNRKIVPASQDQTRIALLIIDAQNTFCHPECADLLVPGAWEDNQRLASFIKDNLERLTAIEVSLDTHTPMQIFHPMFWVDAQGNHPKPFTGITIEDVTNGTWRINPEVGKRFGKSDEWLHDYALYYTDRLGRLDIWPYHALIGSPGHALDWRIEEAVFLHSLARQTRSSGVLKGMRPFTEFYSVIGPEVLTAHDGTVVGTTNIELRERLIDYHTLIVAGQAKSHCVRRTLEHITEYIRYFDCPVSGRIYFLDDCSSSVPGFEQKADEAFQHFAAAGVHIVKSTLPMDQWPDIEL